MLQKYVLLVGDLEHDDFRDARAWLQGQTTLCEARTIDAALVQLTAGPPPHVILVAQARPGYFHQRQIEQLHAASPMSRLVALLGAWCEGETRSGRPWPGVHRIYWHQWRPRFLAELSAASPAGLSTWELPRTATANERLWPTTQIPQRPQAGLVAIHTTAWVMFQGLSDVCRGAGYATAWLPSARLAELRGVSAVIWDTVGCREQDVPELQALVARYRPQQLVALLDFLRPSDRDRALAAGATAVIAKPFLISDLLLELEFSPSRASLR